MDYKKAGVDIEAGYKSVELMKKHVQGTMRSEVLNGLGGFSGAFSLTPFMNMKKPTLLSGTDGGGQSGADRLEGGDGAVPGFTLLEKLTDGCLQGVTESTELEEPGSDAQQNSDADDAYDGGNAPYKSVYGAIDCFDQVINVFHN